MTFDSISYVAFLKASLSSVKITNHDGAKYILSSVNETVIGREATCHVALDPEQHSMVSRYHAKIEPFTDDSQTFWRICDLNAANGTYVNGSRLQGCQNLRAGDRIVLSKGGPEFIFECETISAPAASPVSPAQTSELPSELLTTSAPLSVPNQSTPLPDILPTPLVPATGRTESPLKSLWDLTGEEHVSTLVGHEDLVRSVAFDLSSTLLASGSADKTIKIWDLSSGEAVQTFVGHKLAVTAVAFSPDGKWLASGSADKTVKLWNLDSGESTQQLTGHGMGVNAVLLSSDGILISGSADKTIKIWNLRSGDVQHTLSGHKMGVNAVALSWDNQQLASGGADRTVKLWKVESGEEIVTLPAFRSSINALFFSPNGEFLAISTDDKMLRLWNLKACQEVRIFIGYNWQIGNLAISSNGLMLASGSEGKTVKFWTM